MFLFQKPKHFSSSATVTPRLLFTFAKRIPFTSVLIWILFPSLCDFLLLVLIFSLGEDIFQSSLRNHIWQVNFLKTCMSENVFIIFILDLRLTRYKIINFLSILKVSFHCLPARCTSGDKYSAILVHHSFHVIFFFLPVETFRLFRLRS